MTESHYLALYRKYRPQTFEDVCGRDAIIQTLKNQIKSDRVGHSYLFCGTRGTGKTTIAKIFARAVNCEHPVDGNPCGECESCRAIRRDANLNVVEMDAASNNGVDSVRSIIEQVSYGPTQGKRRVFIIDEVHMLSNAAFNALLKTLEEPPSYAIFILATTEPNKLPVTILSRCQRYDFGRIPAATIAARLQYVCEQEGLTAEDKALRYIASAADGSMRDGLSILDQCNAFNYGNALLTYDKTLEILGAVDTAVFSDLFGAIHDADANRALGILDDLLKEGRELVQFTTDFIGYLRNVMLLKASEDTASGLDVSEDDLRRMLEDARRADLEEVLRYVRVFSELTEQIRYSANRRILTEAAMIRLTAPSMDITRNTDVQWDAMKERVRVLEDKVFRYEQLAAAGITATGTAPVAQVQQTDVLATAASDALTAARPSKQVEPARDAASGQQTVRKTAPALPEALSEDLQVLAARWDALIGAIPQDYHYMKMILRSANPTATADNELLIVFGNVVSYGYFMDGDEAAAHRDVLANYLRQQTGRQVAVRYKLLDNAQRFTDNYVDLRGIRSKVHMEIENDDPV